MEFGKDILDTVPKAQCMKKKINKLNPINIQLFAQQKTLLK